MDRANTIRERNKPTVSASPMDFNNALPTLELFVLFFFSK
jgi:hypothetical protein